jgi:Co/Zn/Cd efflux system component
MALWSWRAGEAGVKLAEGLVPTAPLMGGMVSCVVVNTCVLVPGRHRGEDVNMRSAWLCSRNDVIANLGVLLAACGVALTGTSWPDVIVGLSIAILFSLSAVQVIGAAARQLREAVAGS